MSEVEKMYENAGVEKEYTYNVEQVGKGNVKLLECNKNAILALFPEFNKKNYKVVKVDKFKPFTAEKQLSLMAFLINRKVGLSFKTEQGEITVEVISRGLAGIVNRIWQDLTEQERTDIRSILNG